MHNCDEMAGEKKLVFSILKFLEGQRSSGQLDEEAKESLEVAVQCLEQVYKLNTTKAEFVTKYSVPKNLLDIFTAKVNQTESDMPSLLVHEATAEQKEQAERLKNKGNDFMRLENFSDAIECYSQSIRFDSGNSVYFCNRAAAYSKLNKHKLALEDCSKALAIDPSYSKAYGRMGIAFTALENHKSAYECYRKALELDPHNQSYKNNFEVAEQKMRERPAQAGFNLGAVGGPGNIDFGTIFSNPDIVNMAATIMSNPQVQQMSQQVASQMQQANPGLVQHLREQMRGHSQAGNNTGDQNIDQDANSAKK